MAVNLSEKLFPDILLTVATQGNSGVLTVSGSHHPTKKVHLEEGKIAFVESCLPQENLAEFLVKIGKLAPSQLDGVASETGADLADGLLGEGLIDGKELRELVEVHVQEMLFPLFELTEGTCEFVPGANSLNPLMKLQLQIPNIIFEGIRRLRNRQVLHRGLRTNDSLIRLAAGHQAKVTELFLKPDEAFVLTRIESEMTIAQVIQISPLGLETTQRALYGFIATGVIEFVENRRKQAVADSKDRQTSTAASSFVLERNETPAAQRQQPFERKETQSAEPSTSQKQDSAEVQAIRTDIIQMLERSKTKTYYDLLGVAVGASPDEIKKSYYALAKKYHPDRYQESVASDLKGALDTIFATLSQAYETLKLPSTRAAYDEKAFKEDTAQGSDHQANGASGSGYGYSPAAPQQKLADLNYRQGRGYFDNQDFWGAVQAFRQCVRLDPENAKYRYWLGMSLVKNPKWRREAEEHFLKAIALDQFNAKNHLGLALLYKEVGMTLRAKSKLQEALTLAPNNPSVLEAFDSLSEPKEKGRLQGLKSLFKRK